MNICSEIKLPKKRSITMATYKYRHVVQQLYKDDNPWDPVI